MMMTHPTESGPELTESDRAMLEALDTWRTEMGDSVHGYPETFAAWGAAWEAACTWQRERDAEIAESRAIVNHDDDGCEACDTSFSIAAAIRNQEDAP